MSKLLSTGLLLLFFLLDLFSYVYDSYDTVYPQQGYEILLEADESIKP